MNPISPRCAVPAAVLILLTSIAQAHPGHFILDYRASSLHAGHGDPWSSLAVALLLTALLFMVSHAFAKPGR